MKSVLLTFFFAITHSFLMAGKTYQLTIHVTSLITCENLKGIVIHGTIQKGGELKGITDENGKVTFHALKVKDIDFRISDPNGNFMDKTIYFYNSKKEDQEQSVRMRYSQTKEQDLINSKKKITTTDSTSGNRIDQRLAGFLETCDSLKTTVAAYPGGSKDMMNFLARNIVYPQQAIEEGISGKVYLRIIIEEDGSITNIEVLRGVSPEIDEEAIRIIAYMPNWKPAMCDGKPIRSMVVLPLNFNLT